MRIANMMLGKRLGGIERASIDYTLGLHRQGNDVYMITDPDAAINAELSQRDISHETLGNFGPWDPVAPGKLRAYLRRRPADILIAHGTRAITFAAKAALPDTCKVIAVSHNYRFCPALSQADAVFALTQDMLEKLIAYGVSEEKVVEIPNMIHLDHGFIRRTWGDRPVIGALGRFEKKKGFDVFLHALGILRDKGIAFQAVLGGTGEEETELKKLAARLGLEDVLSFSGWVSDARAFLKTIDIFCLSSRHEPFGIVLLEAMASKLPIIATDSEGPREILGSNGCGILIPKDNPPALADAISTMLEDELIAREMARVAYDTLKGRYSMEFVAQRIELVLHEILNRAPASASEPLDS